MSLLAGPGCVIGWKRWEIKWR